MKGQTISQPMNLVSQAFDELDFLKCSSSLRKFEVLLFVQQRAVSPQITFRCSFMMRYLLQAFSSVNIFYLHKKNLIDNLYKCVLHYWLMKSYKLVFIQRKSVKGCKITVFVCSSYQDVSSPSGKSTSSSSSFLSFIDPRLIPTSSPPHSPSESFAHIHSVFRMISWNAAVGKSASPSGLLFQDETFLSVRCFLLTDCFIDELL